MLFTEKQIESINRDLRFHSTMKGRRVEDIDVCAKPNETVVLQYRYFVPVVKGNGISENQFLREVRYGVMGNVVEVNEVELGNNT